MIEAEWLSISDPKPMLDHLACAVGDRRLRLFAVACCFRVWHRLPDPRSRRAVEAAESFADGGPGADLEAARAGAEEVVPEVRASDRSGHAEWAVVATGMMPDWLPDHWPCIGSVVNYTEMAAGAFAELAGRNRRTRKREFGRGCAAERAAQADLLRCLFGNPFRPVAAEPGWRTSAVVGLAAGIYEDRAWDRLPVLADALDDAGCANADVLGHLRGPGPHARGCWVVDLLLGKA